jgi:succinylglutamic semialdehyde dehydrogenase
MTGGPLRWHTRGHFLDGHWCADPDASPVMSPADLRWQVSTCARGDDWVDAAVDAARRAFVGWRRLPLDTRAGVLERFAQELQASSAALTRLIATEVGKPWWEAEAEAELLPRKVRITLKAARQELAPVVPDGVDGWWDLQPHGVIAVLGPFNFPVHLSNGHIIPALIAGNAVVLKPSPWAPGCADLYVAAWERAAGPWAPVLSLLQGGASTGAALAAHPGVDAVCLTGSRAVGTTLIRCLADQPGKLLALELGGRNAALVLRDADLPHAAREIREAALWSCGQRCTATSRVLVVRSRAEALMEQLAADWHQWEACPPWQADCRLGPLSTAVGRDRFVAAQQEGAGLRTLVAGGEHPSPPSPGYWVLPALHEVVRPAECPARWQEELFGPEVLVEVVDDADEAVARANATPYGLAMSVFTADMSTFRACRESLRAGVVNWNRGTAGASSSMPFGGIKGSGNHRAAGSWSLRYVTWPMATLVR